MDKGAQWFVNKAEEYAKGRRGYAPEALKLILEASPPCAGRTVADMGSGTGILAQELLNLGYAVYGVEPSREMAKKAGERLESFRDFHPVEASAEDTGLPENSVNLVTAASAFHWFDAGRFRKECVRILRPGGMVFLLSNARVPGDGLTREQEALCKLHCPRFTTLHRCSDVTDAVCHTFFTGPFGRRAFPHNLIYSQEEFLNRCLSSSYSPAPGDAGYAAYRGALEQLIRNHARQGSIPVRNETRVWFGRLS